MGISRFTPWGLTKPILGYQIDYSSPLAQGLVACWLFNEGGGLIVLDLIKGNALSASAGTMIRRYASPFNASTLYFNGSTTVSGSVLPVTNYPMSMSCWFNPASTTTEGFLVGVINTNASNIQGFFLDKTSGGNVQVNAWSNAQATAATANLYKANVWNHACGVWVSSTSRFVYLNADASNRGVDTYSSSPITPVTMSLSDTMNGFTTQLTGFMDVVKIWNRALTPSEVWQDYINPFGVIQPIVRRPWVSVSGGTLFTRTASDSPLTSDSLSRLFTGARTLGDGPTTTDSPVRVLTLARSNADNPVTTDALTQLLTLNRTATDSPLTSDAIARVFTGARTTTDAPSTVDSLASVQTLARALADAPLTTDSVTRIFTGARTASDGPSTTDSIVDVQGSIVTTSDAPLTTDSIARALTLARTGSDGPLTSDALARALTLARTTADSPLTSDSVTAALVQSVSTSDTPITSDAAARLLTLLRTASDSPTTLDSVNRQWVGARTTTDAPFTSDSIVVVITPPAGAVPTQVLYARASLAVSPVAPASLTVVLVSPAAITTTLYAYGSQFVANVANQTVDYGEDVTFNVDFPAGTNLTTYSLRWQMLASYGGSVLVTKTSGAGITVGTGPNGANTRAIIAVASADNQQSSAANNVYYYTLARTDSGSKGVALYGEWVINPPRAS